MHFASIELHDVRNHERTTLPLGPGLTALVGANGQGKTNLLEAMAFVGTMESFRGANPEALVRSGADAGTIRADLTDGRRRADVELELRAGRRVRARLNGRSLSRRRDLLGVVRVTLFGPDDLVLVKGPPAGRRVLLDDLVVSLRPAHDDLRRDVDRVLRQRNTLLRQAGGRLDAAASATLDVWDAQLAAAGSALADRRATVTADVSPGVALRYGALAGHDAEVALCYRRSWDGDLADALLRSRPLDLRRGVSTVGPHRDELDIALDGRPARTHASQGEQRSLTLALRLAAHDLVARRTGTVPVVLLDDVYSELDPARQEALTGQLPAGQTVLTSTGALPDRPRPEQVYVVIDGRVTPA